MRRFLDAWEAVDIEGIVSLLADDALLTMPPEPMRIAGPARSARSSPRCRWTGGSTGSSSSRPAPTASRPSPPTLEADATGVSTPTASWCSRVEGDAIAGITGFAGQPEAVRGARAAAAASGAVASPSPSSRSTSSISWRWSSSSRRRKPIVMSRYFCLCGSSAADASPSSSNAEKLGDLPSERRDALSVGPSPTRSAISRRRSGSLFSGVNRTGVRA